MGRFEGGSVTAEARACLAGRVQDRQELPLLPRGGAECTCRKKAPMAVSHLEQFLDQTTIPESGTGCPLACDGFPGLNVSRCLLQGLDSKQDTRRAGMYRCGVDVHDTRLRMTGPAAADYILAGCPATA